MLVWHNKFLICFMRLLFWTEGCTFYSHSRISQPSYWISPSVLSKLITVLTISTAITCCSKSGWGGILPEAAELRSIEVFGFQIASFKYFILKPYVTVFYREGEVDICNLFLTMFEVFLLLNHNEFSPPEKPPLHQAFSNLLHCTYWCIAHLSSQNVSHLPCEHLQITTLPAQKWGFLNC